MANFVLIRFQNDKNDNYSLEEKYSISMQISREKIIFLRIISFIFRFALLTYHKLTNKILLRNHWMIKSFMSIYALNIT